MITTNEREKARELTRKLNQKLITALAAGFFGAFSTIYLLASVVNVIKYQLL